MKKLIVAALLLLPSTAAAQDLAPGDTDTRVKFWSIDTGVRNTYVKDAAYDPYAENDAFTQWSVGMSRTTIMRGDFSFAPGFRWDAGSSSARARGADTNLLAHRLTIPLELRYHEAKWIYFFGRLAPGAMYQRSRVVDASLSEPMVDAGWVPAADVSLGASLMFANFTPDDATSRVPRFWITPEVGYAWSGRASAAMSPKTDTDDPRAFGTLSMTGATLRGAFFRINVTTTF
jgi:hypothetical protein